MNLAVESYKNLGLLGLSIFWFTTVMMIVLLKGDKTKSISSHAASVKRAALIFGIAAMLSAVLLILFFIKWFTPTFNLGLTFNALVMGMLILFGIAGVVPDTTGNQHKIHIWSAVMASVLLLPAMVIIILNAEVSHVAQIFAGFALLAMIVIGFQLLRINRKNDKLLVYEALYFLCFDLSILVATYIR